MKTASLLRNCWYLATQSHRLNRGQLLDRTILGDPVVLGRGGDGKAFALRNVCPHRSMPLSYGSLQGCELQCCYHGWKFNTGTGACMDIPSMSEEQNRQRLQAIKVRSYPVQEVQGNIWIFMSSETARDVGDVPPVPVLAAFPADAKPKVVETIGVRCHLDQTVMGLMDPAHQAFVHTSWWMSTRQFTGRTISKDYGPAPWGYRLIPNQQRKNARLYRLLGRNLTTEFSFQLPSLRIEETRSDRHSVVQLTAITPINEGESVIHALFYWTPPWLAILHPAIRLMLKRFLKQDRDIMLMQDAGLRHKSPQMLVDDADTQSKWYLRLKQEYEKSQQEGRPFTNPVQPRTLQWRT